MNLNKVMQIGRVTKDPELKAIPSGTKVCSFSLANNRVWKDANGAKKEETDFHNVVAFGKTAETIGTWVKKGSLIYIEGRLKTRTWEGADGKKNYRTEIICESFQFGPKAAGASTTAAPAKPVRDQEAEDGMDGIEFPDADIDPNDIPF